MILTLTKGIQHFSYYLLWFDTFSKLEKPLCNISMLTFPTFLSNLNKNNTHTNIIIDFFKIRFVYFKSKFSAKSSVFPNIFHINAVLDAFFEFWARPSFTTITMRYVFPHINIIGIPWILHMQSFKKNHGADF